MSGFSGSGIWLGRTCTNSIIHIQTSSLVFKIDFPSLLGMCSSIRWLETDCQFLRVVGLWEGQPFCTKLLQNPLWLKPNPYWRIRERWTILHWILVFLAPSAYPLPESGLRNATKHSRKEAGFCVFLCVFFLNDIYLIRTSYIICRAQSIMKWGPPVHIFQYHDSRASSECQTLCSFRGCTPMKSSL